MIETVPKLYESEMIEQEKEESSPTLIAITVVSDEEKSSPISNVLGEDKAKELNILFANLPSFYNEDDEDEVEEEESNEGDDEAAAAAAATAAAKKPPETVEPTVTVKTISHQQSRVGQMSSLELKVNQVLPRLFISDDVIARNKTILLKYNITHIVNLTTNIPNKFEPDGIKYLRLVVFDFETQNISQYFSESYEFIESAFRENETNRVLVHCNAGISRSSSFVIAYLLQKRVFKRYKEAYNYVKKARPVIEPNRGFEKQLISFEKRIRRNKGCSIM